MKLQTVCFAAMNACMQCRVDIRTAIISEAEFVNDLKAGATVVHSIAMTFAYSTIAGGAGCENETKWPSSFVVSNALSLGAPLDQPEMARCCC